MKGVIDGVGCGTAEADADGNWVLQIGVDAPCQPAIGDAVAFWLNGVPTSTSETWQPGGAPSDVANGVSLAGEGGVQAPKAGTFAWVVPAKGVGIVVFPGGTIEDAVAAAPQVGSFWVTVDGTFHAYVVGAPGFVNAAFLARFLGGAIPAGSPIVVVV
ncbi:MAG: hypothetical protein GEU80_13645 [Dehalococcoidia bacterium]|nr:hypothetical protein [Dehalococcoidia bacterium]